MSLSVTAILLTFFFNFLRKNVINFSIRICILVDILWTEWIYYVGQWLKLRDHIRVTALEICATKVDLEVSEVHTFNKTYHYFAAGKTYNTTK